MDFTQELTLDLNANTTYTTIVAKQGDSARWLKVHLTKDNYTYYLDEQHSFMFRLRKPDGHGVINPAFVELPFDVTYIPITDQEIFSNDVLYYRYNSETQEYVKVDIDDLFEQSSQGTFVDGDYIKDESTNTYRKAKNTDAPPFYTLKTGIYQAQNNIRRADSTVNIQLTEQILAVPGRGYADIVEYDGTGNVLSSVSFIINIMASPDVAGNATSTDEFQKLVEVVAEADDIIGEAEAWTRGTKNAVQISDPSYIHDDYLTDENAFNKRDKNLLYVRTSDNNFVCVASDAAYATYNSNNAYYYLDASMSNNAKYYAENAATYWNQINGLTVSAYASTSPSVKRNIVDDHIEFSFGLPSGPQGETGDTGPTGPVTCIASDTEPTDDNIIVWIDTNGSMEPFVGTANQILYDETASYDSRTIGNFLNHIGDIYSAAAAASASAATAEKSAAAAFVSAEKAYNSAVLALESTYNVNVALSAETINRENEDSALSNRIDQMIPAPPFETEGIWSLMHNPIRTGSSLYWGHDYYNSLSSKPSINNESLVWGENLELIKNENKVIETRHLNDNIVMSLNNADSAIQLVQLNNNLIVSSRYEAPYVVDTTVTAENWVDVRSSLYYYDIEHLEYASASESDYVTGEIYYTHDLTYDTKSFVNLGTVLNQENIINNNLLDNSWFQINQANFSSIDVNTWGSQLCDRWKVIDCSGQSRTITYDNSSGGGISLSSGRADPLLDATRDFSIGQVLESNLSENLVNKTVCLSVHYIENLESHYSSGAVTCTPYGTPFVPFSENLRWYMKLAKIDDKPNFVFKIAELMSADNQDENNISKPIDIKSVKLEVGNFSTLQNDTPPIYVEELAKCQKYFYKCENSTDKPIVVGQGIAQQATKMVWTFKLPYVMTSDSAIVTTSTDLLVRKGITYTHQAGTLTSSAIESSLRYQGTDGIYFETNTASLASGVPYFILLPEASNDDHPYVTISADI